MLAATLMVQGTASSVGKSLLVTALCRYFARSGIRVAPFKAQNMSLNAAVSSEGLEIGRAQAVQAAAAFVPATADMNPVLIKPEAEQQAQLIVQGRVAGRLHARDFGNHRERLAPVVAAALSRLRERYELVVIEGAGSPAEINLRQNDLVNMHVAHLAGAPVLLAGDIDRGGVFAALVGTLELLSAEDRARIAGFVINKFRGHRQLLEPGLHMLVERTGVPVLGVVPFLRDVRLPREDSEGIEDAFASRAPSPGAALEIAVIAPPHMSNHDDFEPLEHEPGVWLRWVRDAASLGTPALAILPGSKATLSDLAWLRDRGLDRALAAHAARGLRLLGICGGCQMLGESLDDPHAVESPQRSAPGLGLLPLRTRFGREKVTANARARAGRPSFLTAGLLAEGESVAGYEIHMGQVEAHADAEAAFAITERNGLPCASWDGAVNAEGNVVGTMLHGLFEDARLRRGMLAALRAGAAPRAPLPHDARTGGDPLGERGRQERDAHYDRLARAVVEHLDRDRLWALTGLQPRHAWPDAGREPDGDRP